MTQETKSNVQSLAAMLSANELRPPSLTTPKSLEAAIQSATPSAPPPLLSQDVKHELTTGGESDEDTDALREPPQPQPKRRVARRRPAGPVRTSIAANDDVPSIGGLIYALEQKPSTKAFRFVTIASVVWAIVGGAYGYITLSAELGPDSTILSLLAKPAFFYAIASIAVPIAIVWLLATLSWHVAALSLKSSTMTEVAIRLAEPDRMAEQSIASLGQAVRRQVSFMNDAVSRALGRAGELEALVHNEVTQLERSYEENEQKIRGLIRELSGERFELVNTSERVTDTLRTLGRDVPALIDRLSQQQVTLAQIIKGAGENLTSLETSLATSTGRLENTLGNRTQEMQAVLENYTTALSTALGSRTEQMKLEFDGYMQSIDTTLGNRTDNLQTVFEEYAKALDTTLANRSQALDVQLVERTRALDTAFSERLKVFDEQIVRSTGAIDSAVSEKTALLTSALENHAASFKDTISRQAVELDESVMHGIAAVRRTSENITRQSLKAIEGLSSQSDLLKNVSSNLLDQIHGVTNRFEAQGHHILKSANLLESANHKIDVTLQNRHADLSQTLDRLSGKADEFGRFVQGYSSSIEGSISEAETRARATAEQRSRALLAELEQIKSSTEVQSDRAIADMRRRVDTVSNEVNDHLGSLGNRFTETSEDVRRRAAEASRTLELEQARLREEAERLPLTTRESAEAMRRALQDQLKALNELSHLTHRQVAGRDVSAPESAARSTPPPPPSSMPSLTSTLSQEIANRNQVRAALPPASGPAPAPADPGRTDGWSVGDLLARASRDDEQQQNRGQNDGPQAEPFRLNLDLIARAIDPMTAGAIWNRLRSGQRGVMVRSIYSPEGRAAFDEVSRRFTTDADLNRTVARYLGDFERVLKEADARDPTGRLAYTHLISDTGRVYLFLAHASGRLT